MEYLWLCLSAVAAGAVNAVAGGGTLLTYPTLAGILSVHCTNPASRANGSSTVALFPGTFASVWGYRQQIRACKRWIVWLTPPSVLGGALGALLVEEDSFRLVIPYLILLAAVLFLLQPTIARNFKQKVASHPHPQPLSQGEKGEMPPTAFQEESGEMPQPLRQGERGEMSRKTLAVIVVGQFFIGVYGGYFGAGIGILMLSSLSFLGLDDIHQTNALKSFLAFCMNIVAAGLFIARGLVAWEYALAMAVAASAGGYLGTRLSLRLRPVIVRWIVIVIGFSLAAYYFAEKFGWLT
jgi:uncharacterized membrane protein YfcA